MVGRFTTIPLAKRKSGSAWMSEIILRNHSGKRHWFLPSRDQLISEGGMESEVRRHYTLVVQAEK